MTGRAPGGSGVTALDGFLAGERPGAVVHAYAQCTCGTAYSDRWVVDERSEG